MRRWMALLLLAGMLQGCAQTGRLEPSIAHERRSAAALQDDRNIEHTAAQRIAEKYRQNVQVNVTSFNRYVLLTGRVPDEAGRNGIERIVAGIDRVQGIANEIQIAHGSRIFTAHGDLGISKDVRARLLANEVLDLGHIMVYMEEEVVYLLGRVKRAEADAFSAIASTTAKVRKVVRVFEYLD